MDALSIERGMGLDSEVESAMRSDSFQFFITKKNAFFFGAALPSFLWCIFIL